MARRILLINGPNLNLLGTREPTIYGTETLSDVLSAASIQATALGIELEPFQSNHEGAIIDRIQEAGGFSHLIATPATSQQRQRVDAIIINPGGFTHSSIAIRDALLGINVPFIELHVSNVHAREDFRHKSFFSDKAVAIIAGLGVYGYTAAIEFAAKHLKIQGKA